MAVAPDPSLSPKDRIKNAKSNIKFLSDPNSKVLEFWGIWIESIPDKKDLIPSEGYMDYQVAISADLNKLTWRVGGPQSCFIQKMVRKTAVAQEGKKKQKYLNVANV